MVRHCPPLASLPLAVALLAASGAGAAVQDAAVAIRVIRTDSPVEAETLRQRIAAGADFPNLARAHSRDPTAPSGGYLGTFRIPDLRPEFQDALAGVARGETTGVVPVDDGWVILQIATEGEDAWRAVTEAARQALRQGRGADAEGYFREAVAAAEALGAAGRPLLVDSLRDLSALVRIQGDGAEAARLYDRSLEAAWAAPNAEGDSGVHDVVEAFVDVLLLGAFPDAAFEVARERHTEALRRASLDERLYWAMAGVLNAAGMTDEAERTLALGVDAFPDSTASRARLGDHHVDSGNYTQAIDTLRGAIPAASDTAIDPWLGVVPASYLHQRLGDAYGNVVRYEDAVESYRRALDIDPGNPGARFELGRLHYVNNRFEDALLAYDAMLEANPGSVDLLHRIAEAELAAGRFEDAAATARRALQIDADHRRSFYVLGTALVRMGRVEAGRAELTRYGELEAAAGEADRLGQELSTLDNGARTAFADGRADESIGLYRQAIEAHPDVALFRLNLAVAQIRMGRLDDALAGLETVIERGLSDNALVHAALADAHAARGDAGASREHRLESMQRLDAWLRSELE